MEVDWTHLAVVGGWMMFCEAIPFVVFAGLPINSELPLSNAIADPVKAHVNGFGSFCFTVSLMIPSAQALSVWMGVAGWGCPRKRRHCRKVHLSCAL